MENQVMHALYGEIIFKFRVDQEGDEHRTWLLEKRIDWREFTALRKAKEQKDYIISTQKKVSLSIDKPLKQVPLLFE